MEIKTPAMIAKEYIDEMLKKHLEFTGKVELNFLDGDLKNINETKRVNFDKQK
jgi:hypothetical protein